MPKFYSFRTRRIISTSRIRFLIFISILVVLFILNFSLFHQSETKTFELWNPSEISLPRVISNPPKQLLHRLSSSWDHLIRPHLRFLSSNELEGRGTGTRGEIIAVNYIQSYLETLGLKTQIQKVPLVGLTPNSNNYIFSFGSNRNELNLEYLKDFVITSEQNHLPYLDVFEHNLVFVGYGIYAPEYNWNDFKGFSLFTCDQLSLTFSTLNTKDIDLNNKIMVSFVGEPYDSSDESLFKGKELTYYGRWTYKCEQARLRGALGLVLIHTLETATYPFSVLSNQLEQVQLDQDSKNFLLFRSWVTEETAEKLFDLSGYSMNFLKDEASKLNFYPFILPLTLKVYMQFNIRRFTGQNLIALLEGTKQPEEYVMISAHHDHLGIGPPDSSGDEIYNGAVDNASGCSLLLAAATLLASNPPFRSVIFLSLTAEEYGLLGAYYYTMYPIFPLSQTLLDINYDAANVFGKTRDIIGLGLEYSQIKNLFHEIVKREGLYISSDPQPEAGSLFRSDTFAFIRAGIPSLYLWNGQDFEDKPKDYYLQQRKNFISKKYHQPGDEYSNWDLEGASQQLKVGIRMIWAVANDLKFRTKSLNR